MKTKKTSNVIISKFLFLILFVQTFSNYIILPFNTKKINSSSFISQTNYYTLLSIGQPQKTIEIYLSLNQNSFYLGKGLCQLNSFSDYLPYGSETFKNYSDYIYLIDNIKNATNASDKYSFYIDDLNLKKNITVKDILFHYGVNRYEYKIVDKEKICGIIGLNVYYKSSESENNHFANILKQKNITSYYTFSFIYFNNYTKNANLKKNDKYDNLLIIGMNETEISKLFNTNDLRNIKVSRLYSSYDWRILFDEVFLNLDYFDNISTNKTLISSNIIATFNNEFDFIIIRIKEFNLILNSFFNKYIEKNICIINEDSLFYKYISCDLSFKTEINKFPSINFMIRDINYTFTLTYEDLFVELNDKIYFMIINEYYHTYHWTLGNIFLKKFPLIFDYDNKMITFININSTVHDEEGEKQKAYTLLFIIGGICIIIGISLGVIFGKVIWDKKKKKRANELTDDYDYNINQNDNEQNLYDSSNTVNN